MFRSTYAVQNSPTVMFMSVIKWSGVIFEFRLRIPSILRTCFVLRFRMVSMILSNRFTDIFPGVIHISMSSEGSDELHDSELIDSEDIKFNKIYFFVDREEYFFYALIIPQNPQKCCTKPIKKKKKSWSL